MYPLGTFFFWGGGGGGGISVTSNTATYYRSDDVSIHRSIDPSIHRSSDPAIYRARAARFWVGGLKREPDSFLFFLEGEGGGGGAEACYPGKINNYEF